MFLAFLEEVVAVLPSRQRLVIGHISEGVAPGYYFLTSSLLFAIRWRTMIISELRRIIGWFWVAQAFKERPEGAKALACKRL